MSEFLSDLTSRVLDGIAHGGGADEVLVDLCLSFERELPESIVGVTILDRSARVFEHAIFPSLADDYAAALKGYEEAKAFNFISRYGECVVRVNPAAVRALLLSRPETDEERTRFTALSTAFGTCLPEGQTLSFGKLPLRGTLAVNYYRLAMAAASMPRAPVQ